VVRGFGRGWAKEVVDIGEAVETVRRNEAEYYWKVLTVSEETPRPVVEAWF